MPSFGRALYRGGMMISDVEKEERRQHYRAGTERLFDLITEKHGGVVMEAGDSELGTKIYQLYCEEGLTTAKVAERVDSWVLAGTVRIADTPETRIEEALSCAFTHAGIDGSWHKDYCIDQMVRALTGNEYRQWVKDYENGEDGPNTYEWEIGSP